jgi:hypothetical protein
MRNLRPSKTTLSFLLPTLALPLGLLVGSIMAMTPPPPVNDEPEVEIAPAEDTPPARIYHAFLSPVTVSLPRDTGRLNLELGVALPKDQENTLKKTLENSPEAILGNLATVVLAAIDADSADVDSAHLREILPDALLTAINTNLVAMGEPPDILEVLIIDWAFLP